MTRPLRSAQLRNRLLLVLFAGPIGFGGAALLASCGGSAEVEDPSASAGGVGGTGGVGGSLTGGVGGTVTGGVGGTVTGGVGGTAIGGVGGTVTGGTGNVASTVGVCSEPKDLGGGWVECKEGYAHRVSLGECKNALPASAGCGTETCDGTKLQVCGPGNGFAPSCETGCLKDSDCAAGSICQCGADIGRCVAASCTTDADCAPAALCGTLVVPNNGYGCGQAIWAQCQRADDECASELDCPEPSMYQCKPAELGGPRQCVKNSGPACGRPFLVDATARLAPVVASDDWSGALAALDDLGARQLEAGRAYAALGQMEHASVGAFARFTLQLLALGAPPDLIDGSNQAALDESEHAKGCFALASVLLGEPVGPGPLDVRGALDRLALSDVVRDVFLEGCVGETIAALEASEALASCTLPAAANLWARIVEDEARHAELAWRFVAWAVKREPTLLHDLESLLAEQLLDAAPVTGTGTATATSEVQTPTLAPLGIVGEARRATLRREALRDVVTPCLAALRDTPAQLTTAIATA